MSATKRGSGEKEGKKKKKKKTMYFLFNHPPIWLLYIPGPDRKGRKKGKKRKEKKGG